MYVCITGGKMQQRLQNTTNLYICTSIVLHIRLWLHQHIPTSSTKLHPCSFSVVCMCIATLQYWVCYYHCLCHLSCYIQGLEL